MRRFFQTDTGVLASLLAVILALVVAGSFGGCAHLPGDRAMLYTEAGLQAAEARWDQHFYEVLEHCKGLHDPGTLGAIECFGPTYETNEKIETAVRAAVGLLRAYWTARAAGEDPSWDGTSARVAAILGDLPPDVRQYFERVQGV